MRIATLRQAIGFVLALIVVGALGVVLCKKIVYLIDTPQRQAREFVRRQIAGLEPAKTNTVFVSNEGGPAQIDEFLKSRNELRHEWHCRLWHLNLRRCALQ